MRALALVATLALVASCRANQQRTRTDAERVLAYLQCQECLDGERKAVIAMGDTATPLLRQFLLNGPPVERVQLVDDQLQRLAPNALANIRSAQLTDYVATYRQRAADALGEINGAAAHDALCAARLRPNLRYDERAAIDTALAGQTGPCP